MRIRGACDGASPSAASHGLVRAAWRSRARADACVAVSRRRRTEAGARASPPRAARTRIDTARQPLHRTGRPAPEPRAARPRPARNPIDPLRGS